MQRFDIFEKRFIVIFVIVFSDMTEMLNTINKRRVFDTDLLENFINILDHKGFTAAARWTCSTQSTVSGKLARLEAQVGQQLMQRNKRGVICLTPAGQIVENMARGVARLQQEAIRRLNETQVTGRVRVGMSDDIASGHAYASVLSEFASRQPGINLEVIVGNGGKILSLYDNNELDHILIKTRDTLPIEAKKLWIEQLVWVGKLHDRNTDVRLVTFSPPCLYRDKAIDILRTQGCAWREVYVSPSLTGVLAAIGAGLGLTILPESLVTDDLQVIPDDIFPAAGAMVFAILSRQELTNAANTLFHNLMVEIIPKAVLGRVDLVRPSPNRSG